MTNPNKLRRTIPALLLAAAGATACSGGGGGEQKTTTAPRSVTLAPAVCNEIVVAYNPQDPYYVHLTLNHDNVTEPGLRGVSQINYDFGDTHTKKDTSTSTFHKYETAGEFTINATIEVEDSFNSPTPKGTAACPPIEVTIPHS